MSENCIGNSFTLVFRESVINYSTKLEQSPWNYLPCICQGGMPPLLDDPPLHVVTNLWGLFRGKILQGNPCVVNRPYWAVS